MTTMTTIFDLLGEETADGLIELFNDDIKQVLKELDICVDTSKQEEQLELRQLTQQQNENLKIYYKQDFISTIRTIDKVVIINLETVKFPNGGYSVTLDFYYPLCSDMALAVFADWLDRRIPQRVEKEVLRDLQGHFGSDKLLEGIWNIKNIDVFFHAEIKILTKQINYPQEPDLDYDFFSESLDAYDININVSFELDNVDEIMPGGKLYEEAQTRYEKTGKKHTKN